MFMFNPSSQSLRSKSKISHVKSGRLERLRKRMTSYRRRSEDQRKVQIIREGNLLKNADAMGFNLFCKEFEPQDNKSNNTLSCPEVLEFNETYFQTSAKSVSATHIPGGNESCLCWICGGMFQSKNLLRKHAEDDHFSEWLASKTFFEFDEMLKLR